jgi:hypothetical protein
MKAMSTPKVSRARINQRFAPGNECNVVGSLILLLRFLTAHAGL